MVLDNFIVQLLYTGSYRSTLVKQKTLRMRFFKKDHNEQKTIGNIEHTQENFYTKSERDRQDPTGSEYCVKTYDKKKGYARKKS